jgi:hypothetical protein
MPPEPLHKLSPCLFGRWCLFISMKGGPRSHLCPSSSTPRRGPKSYRAWCRSLSQRVICRNFLQADRTRSLHGKASTSHLEPQGTGAQNGFNMPVGGYRMASISSPNAKGRVNILLSSRLALRELFPVSKVVSKPLTVPSSSLGVFEAVICLHNVALPIPAAFAALAVEYPALRRALA